jgi:type IV pilus assembly protein PilB
VQAGFSEQDLDGSWQAYGPLGCDHCFGTGYKGRMGIYEVMPITDDMRQVVSATAPFSTSPSRPRRKVCALRQSGLLKVKQGLTSLEEIEAVTNE